MHTPLLPLSACLYKMHRRAQGGESYHLPNTEARLSTSEQTSRERWCLRLVRVTIILNTQHWPIGLCLVIWWSCIYQSVIYFIPHSLCQVYMVQIYSTCCHLIGHNLLWILLWALRCPIGYAHHCCSGFFFPWVVEYYVWIAHHKIWILFWLYV